MTPRRPIRVVPALVVPLSVGPAFVVPLSVVPAFVVLAGLASPAAAQMMLPGAMNGNQPGAPPKAAGGTPASAPLKPIVIKPPATDTILGKPLSRDGHDGTLTFERTGNGLTLTKARLAGDKISRPQDVCTIDVPIDAPVVATPAGQPSGTLRYDVPLATCPFTIDVLDGATLVSRPEPSCEFKTADCRVTPGGLWGPPAAEITPARAKDLEHQRVRLETTMRTNFRALLKKAGKDRAAIKDIAREQAAFSSEREMTCRDYDKEAEHGFCSTQITQARALALLARFGLLEKPDEPAKRPAKPKQPKPKKPPAPAPGTPATAGPPPAASAQPAPPPPATQ